MRRAAYILSWFCVSAVIMPVTLRVAADTNSRSGVVITKSAMADSLPQAVRQTPPHGATLSRIPINAQNYDPHPFITEFIGPVPAPKAPPKAKSAAAKPLPQARLNPVPR